jgi:hypothetical protein
MEAAIQSGGEPMKIAVLGLCFAALALGACRREAPEYTPMKLGAASVAVHDAAQR